jgi:hypothetical protein
MTAPRALGDPTPAMNRDVVARQVGEEMVLLDLESGTYYTLNEVGAVVWRKLGAGETLDAIVDAIVTEFDAEAPAVRDDVARLVADLRSHRLLLDE